MLARSTNVRHRASNESRARQTAIGDDGVGHRDEDVEQDRHAPHACQRRQDDDVEPTGIQREDDITPRCAQEPIHELCVRGDRGRQQRTQRSPGDLVARAAPQPNVAARYLMPALLEQTDEAAVAAEIRVVRCRPL